MSSAPSAVPRPRLRKMPRSRPGWAVPSRRRMRRSSPHRATPATRAPAAATPRSAVLAMRARHCRGTRARPVSTCGSIGSLRRWWHQR
jgi:hypothetical protein